MATPPPYPSDPLLPEGVRLGRLVSHHDDRGRLVEIFRSTWENEFAPVQWNLVRSQEATLRGVHVHVVHFDYLLCVDGRMDVALRDLRRDSPTAGRVAAVSLLGDEPSTLTIPPGVAHGFFFPVPSTHVYAVSEYWNLEDELGCHWADPALELPWEIDPRHVSDRDSTAGSLAEMINELEARRVSSKSSFAVDSKFAPVTSAPTR